MSDDVGGPIDVVLHRLDRAQRTLTLAGSLVEMGELEGAVNRSYYACFYAVSALLLQHGMKSRKHRGIRSLFNQHFAKTGMISNDFTRTFNSLFDLRQDSDYRDFVQFEPDDVRRFCSEAKRFVDEIRRIVEREIQNK